MRGYRTRTVLGLVARHHRPTASADGVVRGRARHGRCAYIVRFTLPWVTMRAFKVARERPRGVSGVEDPEFRDFVRRELRQRARSELAQRLPLPRAPLPLADRGH